VNPQTQAITNVNLGAGQRPRGNGAPAGSQHLPSSALDFVGDVTGVITSVNGPAQTVVVQTATRGSITATASDSTIVSPNCTTFNLGNTFTCAKKGQVASLDMTLTRKASLAFWNTIRWLSTAGDWIEGHRQFTAVLVHTIPDGDERRRNCAIEQPHRTRPLTLAAPVLVTLVNPQPFIVDTKGLTVPTSLFSGSTATSVCYLRDCLGARDCVHAGL